jgi:hypothetical protein
MAIKKQEFYEGAALHLLARSGRITALHYAPPIFTINDTLKVLLKYSTKGRSPWGFTFTPDEQQALAAIRGAGVVNIIGLVCGSDGVAAIDANDYFAIASPKQSAIHIACYRSHREHYEINGPDGTLARKVPPSAWQHILGE